MNVDEMLKALEPPAEWPVDSADALRRVHAAAKLNPAESPRRRRIWYRALVAAAALTAMLLLPAARIGAQWLWRILHPGRVSVVELPYELPPEVLALGAKLLSPAGTPTAVASRADAERQVGFTMRLPRAGTLSSEPRFVVVNPGPLYEQQLDRAKFQFAVESLHRPELLVPAAPDGASVRVGFSPGVAALYGQCEDLDCDVTFSQTLVPQIAVSDGVDMAAWIEFSLRLAGIGASDAHRYAAALDSVLPIFLTLPEAGSLGETHVSGAPAALFRSTAGDGTPRNSVFWASGGRLYSLSARGSADFALSVANALQ